MSLQEPRSLWGRTQARPEIHFEGYLEHQLPPDGVSTVTRWESRWCLLSEGEFHYSGGSPGNSPSGLGGEDSTPPGSRRPLRSGSVPLEYASSVRTVSSVNI